MRNCEYCELPLEVEKEKDKRIKYHPSCKKEVERMRKIDYYESHKKEIYKAQKKWKNENKDKLLKYAKKNNLKRKEERKNWLKNRVDIKDLPETREIKILNKLSKKLLYSD